MSGVESNTSFEENREKYKDFREMLSDSRLSEEEMDELESSYYSECQEIREEASDECSILLKEVEYYKEMTQMSRNEIRVLQSLGGFQGSERDGLRGPNTFAAYMEFGDEYPLLAGLSPKQVVERYNIYIEETFESLDEEVRKDIQRKVGTHDDGQYGPNTLGKIGENFFRVKDVFSFELHHGVGKSGDVVALQAQMEELNTYILDPNQSGDVIPGTDFNLGYEEGLENTSYSELQEKYGDKLADSMKYINEKVSSFNLQRLALYFELNQNDPEFTEKLSLKILEFQDREGLKIDGKPGPRTLNNIDFTEVQRKMYAEAYKGSDNAPDNINTLSNIGELMSAVTPDIILAGVPGYPRNLKSELVARLPALRDQAGEGFQRLCQNVGGRGMQMTKDTPVTIYVADTSDRRFSTAFTYNPIDGKIHTFPFLYGVNNFSDEKGSRGTPTGSFMIGRINIPRGLYDKASFGKSRSPRGAAMDTVGLEPSNQYTSSDKYSGITDSKGSYRGAYTHGISESRSAKLARGEGGTSWGCRAMEAQRARWLANIYRQAEPGFEEVTMI